ncbi:MAG: DUF3380 domain-containing protein [Rhodobacteraceae bacterium]|nr:DUF3380 domain-containing protein [Paracoccaceae bacterium]
MSARAFTNAAERIGCDVAVIRAIWQVESSGRGFQPDGTLARRFEPHKMPGSDLTWRDSKKIGSARREGMFLDAYEGNPEAALQATSWGGPQIMGFNFEAAGFPSARAMVLRLADSEDAHLDAFVALVLAWGLDGAIRAHDWQTIETRYNGGGQGGAYARKMEAAYRSITGKASAAVLRIGSSGAAVRKLQSALGVEAHGAFDQVTDHAVRELQKRADLPVDGIVGARTWAALERRRDVTPKAQPTTTDDVIDKTIAGALKGALPALGGAGGGALLDRAPQGAMDLLFYGAAALALAVAALWIWRRARGAA